MRCCYSELIYEDKGPYQCPLLATSDNLAELYKSFILLAIYKCNVVSLTVFYPIPKLQCHTHSLFPRCLISFYQLVSDAWAGNIYSRLSFSAFVYSMHFWLAQSPVDSDKRAKCSRRHLAWKNPPVSASV